MVVLAGRAIAPLLIWPAVTAFLALNFTGSSTFTSRNGSAAKSLLTFR